MKFWTLLIFGAVSPFLFTSALPWGITFVLVILTLLCGFILTPSLKILCVPPFFFLLTTLAVNDRLSQRLPFSDSKPSYRLSGVIGGLPVTDDNGVRFLFLPETRGLPVPSKIYVNWYRDRHMAENPAADLPKIHAGERWQLQLVLRAPRGRVNFHGADVERWYFTEGIGALAYVQDGENIRLSGPAWFNPDYWREAALERLRQQAGDVPAFRILAALAVADRRGLLARDREVLSATGTGHLLAISGLHIGLAAVFGFYLGRLALVFPSAVIKQSLAVILPWVFAWLAAFLYSALSGFGVSTQRALIMLTVATVVTLSRRNVHPLQAWLIAMSLVLLADPFAPLRAGFWFSFVAVGVLMMLFLPRHGHLPAWRKMLLAQLGISLFMAPLGMYWFQQASLPGFFANLVAIPLISFLTVPLVLAAMAVAWLPVPLTAWALKLAGYSAHYLFKVLEIVAAFQPDGFSATRVPMLAAIVLAMLGAALILLPRVTPVRFAGLLLMIPLVLPAGDSVGAQKVQIDYLDVGQGLSVLLTTPGYQLVYDTGPGNGLGGEAGLDMVAGTIQPMIRAGGRMPDLVVASHADLDHAGGLERLRSIYPDADYLASLPVERSGVRPCVAPGSWMGGNLEFRILHPSSGLPYLGNDSSCVISVIGPGVSLLLSGDISEAVETRLVDAGLSPHAILSAPHHGSSTSSSQGFIDAVRPSWVLISTAAGNRFGFPRADVLERYANTYTPTLSTAQCGGLRLLTDVTGALRIQSARVGRKAIWRWPANPDCP